MLHPVRRIVTGHDAEGRAICLKDEIVTNTLESEAKPGRGLSDLWRTFESPPSNAGAADDGLHPVQLLPPPGGSVFRFFQVRPAKLDAGLSETQRKAEARAVFEQMGAGAQHIEDGPNWAMHKTETVDYIVLLKGEVTLILEDGEYDMKPMDVVIQRGTAHAWVNRGDEPAVLAGVLIDAVPLK